MKKYFFSLCFRVKRLMEREKIARIKSLMRFCGTEVRIDPTCNIFVPQQLEVGNNTSISTHTVIYATYGVKIGNNCLISSNCGISSYNHITESLNRPAHIMEDKNYSKPVIIGDNVWIGMNACILPGVVIGNNSIIGSGSVVTKSVPANEVWVGNPARFVKQLAFNN